MAALPSRTNVSWPSTPMPPIGGHVGQPWADRWGPAPKVGLPSDASPSVCSPQLLLHGGKSQLISLTLSKTEVPLLGGSPSISDTSSVLPSAPVWPTVAAGRGPSVAYVHPLTSDQRPEHRAVCYWRKCLSNVSRWARTRLISLIGPAMLCTPHRRSSCRFYRSNSTGCCPRCRQPDPVQSGARLSAIVRQ
jgi:hypothetical protein